ncbi:MAG: MFS transporter [Planctomycetota bacterium]
MIESLGRFFQIPKSVALVLVANLLVSLVNGGVMLIFNIYLRKQGYLDPAIAQFTAYRFAGVLLLALPVGMLLRGRRLKPFLWLSVMTIPLSAWFMVVAAEQKDEMLLAITMTTWGVGMMFGQVATLPFILRETTEEARTEAISLSFAAWSLALLSSGAVIPTLQWIGQIELGSWIWQFDDPGVLRTMILASLLAIPLLLLAREGPPPEERKLRVWSARREYDWGLIIRATIPNMFVAVGAGLTIPFISLFFNGVFGLTSAEFSVLGGAAGIPVLAGFLLNPAIKRRFGYGAAIVLSQSLSVFFLICLAMTELLKDVSGMVWVAGGCFLLRQPLMNMAAPITSDLAINYVGARNRELISALGASIWSGAWFLSAKIFEYLRNRDFTYWQVFLVTAALYIFATFLYWRLIQDHKRRQAARASQEAAAPTT